jgi:D-beta-D-heptose 7-phosphate kinase/D-beta-D-heptose 1-phosphate adenosyltransferase
MNIVVNGCFDILHKGHLDLLEFAAKQGDNLTVLIDADYRITNNKGKDRPYNDHYFRKKILESLKFVNKVVIFETDYQLEQYILQLKPCIMVKGEEYINKKIIGAEHCEDIIFFPILEGYSSTKLIKQITKK